MLGLTAPPTLISFAAFRTRVVVKLLFCTPKNLTNFRSRMPAQHSRLTLLKSTYENLQVFG